MGLGRFKNGKFDLIVVANFIMDNDNWIAWENCLKKSSEILYNASEGQMEYGNLFVCDDNIGADTADFFLHGSGDVSSANGVPFGNPGSAIHLMPNVKNAGPATVLHEMGHNVWDLGEEYAGTSFTETVDKSSPAQDNSTIPIIDSGLGIDELVGMMAILWFDGVIERRMVTANTATSVTVSPNYTDLPTNCFGETLTIQPPAECVDLSINPNYCLMQRSKSGAGFFDWNTGIWTEKPYPITEFCSPANHDPDGETDQSNKHNKSCWETIISTPGFTHLTMPDPATSEPTTGWTEPNWIVLDKQPRFALVLDRSYSMASGNKMEDAKNGAIYWLEFCKESNDLLTIIWYDTYIERILDLTEVSTLPDLNAQISEIEALQPRFSTNIRDALYDALGQMQTLPTRAAVQVALLLTDGKHNTPQGSQATEVLPSFQEEGVRIYSLGVGGMDEVDPEVLETLAGETGGTSYIVDDNQQGDIQNAMAEINSQVRGGIITTAPYIFPDAPPTDLDDFIQKYKKKTRRPRFIEILKKLKIRSIRTLMNRKGSIKDRIISIPVDIEKGSQRVSFTITHPSDQELWLYLISPKRELIERSAAGIHHVISPAPHEFTIIENPQAGRWHMIVFRPNSGNLFYFRALVGAENKELQVFGGVSRNNPSGSPVRLWATAQWKFQLSNLQVNAEIVDPDGASRKVKLTDDRGIEPYGGVYESFILPVKEGRYHGTIRIENPGQARLAKSLYILSHTRRRKMSLRKRTPRFIREIPFFFSYGAVPETKDDEVIKGMTEKYSGVKPRSRKLRSAVSLDRNPKTPKKKRRAKRSSRYG